MQTNAAGFRVYTQFICGSHGSLFDPSTNPATTKEMQQEAVTFAAGIPGIPLPAGDVILMGVGPPQGQGNLTVIAPQPAGTACP